MNERESYPKVLSAGNFNDPNSKQITRPITSSLLRLRTEQRERQSSAQQANIQLPTFKSQVYDGEAHDDQINFDRQSQLSQVNSIVVSEQPIANLPERLPSLDGQGNKNYHSPFIFPVLPASGNDLSTRTPFDSALSESVIQGNIESFLSAGDGLRKTTAAQSPDVLVAPSKTAASPNSDPFSDSEIQYNVESFFSAGARTGGPTGSPDPAITSECPLVSNDVVGVIRDKRNKIESFLPTDDGVRAATTAEYADFQKTLEGRVTENDVVGFTGAESSGLVSRIRRQLPKKAKSDPCISLSPWSDAADGIEGTLKMMFRFNH